MIEQEGLIHDDRTKHPPAIDEADRDRSIRSAISRITGR